VLSSTNWAIFFITAHHDTPIMAGMWREFRTFIARGNVIDLAAAVIIGAAFGRVVTTVVEGILMPPIGLVLGGADFSSLFFVLDTSQGVPASLADARTRGIPVVAYGQLGNDLVTFGIVALAVFLLVRQVNRLDKEPLAEPSTRPCPYCTLPIPMKANRCPQCTSQLA